MDFIDSQEEQQPATLFGILLAILALIGCVTQYTSLIDIDAILTVI